MKGYYTLDAILVDGIWLFAKRWSDGDDTEPPELEEPQWSSVKLDVKCRQCGRHVPLTPETIQRLGLLVIDDDTPTLDVSLLS